MNTLLKKLNFKGQSTILVINCPKSLMTEIEDFKSYTNIITEVDTQDKTQFLMCFVTKLIEIEDLARKIPQYIVEDAIIWMCYPKGSSKNFTCEFNRDNGWAALGSMGLEPVRMVAIDDDWSGLRFRNVEKIKSITRRESYALTKEAKIRTSQKGK
ncbi:MAG: hypothetical protein ACRCVT_03040 [Leadbetterella sp.]